MNEQQLDKPDNVIVVLMDSLNRHLLGAYGGTEFETPNLDAFAARSVRFDKHYAGSLPCMPARHDILCGALDFLWRPWGSIELWESAITAPLRDHGVTTMLVSDHPHLFETGGENYHTDFHGWDYLRGGESDPWRTRPDPSWIGAPVLPVASSSFGPRKQYNLSRTWFRQESDFPGPKTMHTAAGWLRSSAGFHDRFLLFVDEFDPHEPFDTPAPWAGQYDPDWRDPMMIWPPYAVRAVASGVITERQARHVRANYGSKLSMIDHWFGKVLEALEDTGLTESTAVILCTDHGHYLGERDLFGKPDAPHYEPMSHLPLMISAPGLIPGTCNALTTNVDIHATLADIFGLAIEHRTHGCSLWPLLTGEQQTIRQWALAGVWGGWVHVLDTHRKYARSTVDDGNLPLTLWSNRWSTLSGSAHTIKLPKPDRRARLAFMPGSDVPVICQSYQPGDRLPHWAAHHRPDDHHCFDLSVDPGEQENRVNSADERDMIELLHTALTAVEAPEDQFVRLGIA